MTRFNGLISRLQCGGAWSFFNVYLDHPQPSSKQCEIGLVLTEESEVGCSITVRLREDGQVRAFSLTTSHEELSRILTELGKSLKAETEKP